MSDKEAQFIDVSHLTVGHYIYLDVGWLGHPFTLNNFRIASTEQIEAIRRLGLERIRYSPELSQIDALPFADAEPEEATAGAAPVSADPKAPEAQANVERRRALLAAQRARLQECENRFIEATQTYRQALEMAHARPTEARQRSEALVDGLIGQLDGGGGESYVRLLSEKAGEKMSLHAVNVTILSMLLGRTLGFDSDTLRALGLGALLHDIGKLDLPDRLRWSDDRFSVAERELYREHVGYGVNLACRMGLPKTVQLIIGQHHEFADGSGYPQQVLAEQIIPAARVVALVNHYDTLCNPANPALAITPHEAMSLIYAQSRHQFEKITLTTFIRMMGVYPPGSVIELNDGRFAMVASVNSNRTLRPRIIVHDPAVPPAEALVLDLEQEPGLGIRRSLKPVQLPRAAYDYLSPRKRLCYFFERGREGEPAPAREDESAQP